MIQTLDGRWNLQGEDPAFSEARGRRWRGKRWRAWAGGMGLGSLSFPYWLVDFSPAIPGAPGRGPMAGMSQVGGWREVSKEGS
jgi:hypothetical protein